MSFYKISRKFTVTVRRLLLAVFGVQLKLIIENKSTKFSLYFWHLIYFGFFVPGSLCSLVSGKSIFHIKSTNYSLKWPRIYGSTGPESDEEIRRVPELGGESAGTSASRPDNGVVQGRGVSQRKRGRSAADKETKRLKRLLRNRVSAQQARERKKAYLNDLETSVKDLEKKNTELEERLSTLQNENQMLRHILKNTTASRRGGSGGANEGTL